ncbi:PilZ domain-containing protein [Desulfonema limicola]|uniref:PilZ domain-containing protein n=1 Tax=Desulfonema limicola TaxID=45656 RepID=A0A975B6E3_9BACT|nr:PilZ domain-containing protein [Desulfonema limicola]QTA79595.1 PilZ domain-containing protein [Desulfonema limicola]
MLITLSSLMDRISVFYSERRKDFRHPVICDALLNIWCPDFQDNLAVTVANLSTTGALIYADQVFVHRHHLISIDDTPQLCLKMKLSDEYFESPVEIKWYKWSVEKNCFEIGVSFILMLEKTRIAVTRFIAKLRHRASY